MKSKRNTILIILLVAAIVLATLYFAFFRKELVKLRYPLEHKDYVMRYSAEYELDPYLVLAVICCESGFRENVVSGAGACGLMQIMPATGDEIAQKLGVEDYNLFDPATNIRFGCYYLHELSLRFDGKVPVMLAGYNAGPNRADEWIMQYGVNSDGAIKYVPYPETDKYIERVESAERAYKKLYPQLKIGE
ncbi:MAG TPA: lytic transglycosylase domain-containing protein [Eubacteriales bacterium]|nr:lytic transglycosylase domain-containing protein [Eubacteriales bacterium]